MAADKKPPLGLALSGGGFRATIFHLGVIRYMREKGLLSSLTHISSVSGGSVIAAHLVANWERYTGDEAAFAAAAGEVVEFVRSDARGKLFSRWIAGWSRVISATLLPAIALWYWNAGWTAWYVWIAWLIVLFVACRCRILRWSRYPKWPHSRSTLLAAGYENTLFTGMKLRSLADHPKLMIATTDLTTGNVCYFSGDGLHEVGTRILWATNRPSLAFAVATSSAFPPGFAPMEVSDRILEVDKREMPIRHFLTDGGVFDNLGGSLLEAAGINETDIIISSAEPRPDIDGGSSFTFLAKRAARSTDILMERVSDLESKRRAKALQIRLQDDIPNSPISPDKQHQLRTTRTDLNSFSALEVQCLYYKGYEAASNAYGESEVTAFEFKNEVPTIAKAGHWLPIAETDKGLNTEFATLDNASSFSIGILLWKAIGWAAIPYVLLFLLYIAISWWMTPWFLKGDARRWNATEYHDAFIAKNPWLQAFLVDARAAKTSDDKDVIVASIESNPLDESFFSLRPNSFDYYVGSQRGDGKILSCQAFLKNERGELYRILPITNVEDEIRIQVLQPQRKDRLFVLLGLSWPKDAEADLIKKSIRFYKHKGQLDD